MLDELVGVVRAEDGLREHEFTPAGVEAAVRLATGGDRLPDGRVVGGDARAAAVCRAKAELADARSRGV